LSFLGYGQNKANSLIECSRGKDWGSKYSSIELTAHLFHATTFWLFPTRD
jgi:hypothetical protein